jgi:hypothetical protein
VKGQDESRHISTKETFAMRSIQIVFAVAAGFLGGLLSRYTAVPAVFAQDQVEMKPAVVQELRARSFVLADEKGEAIATFRPGRPGRLAPGRYSANTPVVALEDGFGRMIWSAPSVATLQRLQYPEK